MLPLFFVMRVLRLVGVGRQYIGHVVENDPARLALQCFKGSTERNGIIPDCEEIQVILITVGW